MEQVMQYLIEFSPAITAVIGILVSLIVGIKKIKGHNDKTLEEVKAAEAKIVDLNAQILEENEKLRNENQQLQNKLDGIIAHINHIHKK